MVIILLLLTAVILAIFSIHSTSIHFHSKILFKNPLTAGGTILVINIILITITALGAIYIPFFFLIFMYLSPVLSVLAWSYIKSGFQKSFRNRLYAILIGQSVYIVLLIYLIFESISSQSVDSAENSCMGPYLGLFIGMAVCIFATVIGIAIFLLPELSNKLKLL
ncbi:MAG: hypothetical protein ACO1OT_15970 [Heyndrickxia sp.]